MKNEAIIKITNCLNCPYVDCQYWDIEGDSEIYCNLSHEFLMESKTRWLINGYTTIPVPDNCPLLNKE